MEGMKMCIRDRDKVEQTIMMQEAMDKKLENMEQRRRKLFVSLSLIHI